MSVALNELAGDPVVQTLGLTQPSLYRVIVDQDGGTVDMTGAQVLFYMRPLLSRAPVVQGTAVPLAPPDNEGHNVRYDWAAADVAIEGQYMGWWHYTLPGLPAQETPEFPIVISDHGPGFGSPTGPVVDGVGAWMPTSLRALRRDPHFGDRFLQRHADYVKRIVMGTVLPPDTESTYDPALIDYLSKRTALRLIVPAKDYWSRQHRTVTTTGTSEVASYPDMLAALDQLALRLESELPQDWRQLQRLVPGLPQLHVSATPASSITATHRTPDPYCTPRLGNSRWGPW